MREILSQGLDGAIVVIDNSKGLTSTDKNIINRLNSNDIPFVIFANKQDISSEVNDYDGITDAPIIPTIAREGEGVKNGLDLLLDLMGN
jgi:signal recognition particle receptor subunit beta